MNDPAVLFYINDWLTSTAEMDADVRGWYLNLLLHNYDKSDLPNDVEKLAVLCNVKFSEYERFKHVFEHVLKQKFELNEKNRLSNEKTSKILRSREAFKDKRSNAGKVSYIMKYMAKNYTKQYKDVVLRTFIKNKFDYNLDLKNEQVLKQVFEHLFELYINENENENEIIYENINGQNSNFENKNLDFLFLLKNESKTWLETVSMQQKIDVPLILKELDEFELFLRTIEKVHVSKKEFVSHFINWLSKKNNLEKNGKSKNNTPTNKQQFRFSTAQAIETITSSNK